MKFTGLIIAVITIQQVAVVACNEGNECPPQKPYCSNKGCLYKCPDTFYINGTDCVPECGDMFVDNKRCLPSCPESSPLVRENIKAIGRDVSIEKECTDRCTSKEYEYNGTCNNFCPPNASFLDGNKCVESCPINKPLLDNVTEATTYTRCADRCPLYTNVENGSCVHECSENKHIFDQTCVDKCPTSHPFVSVSGCIEQCYSSTVHIENETCYNTCPSNLPYYWNGSCADVCPDNFKLTTNKNGVNHCVNECSAGLFLNNNTCINVCPDNNLAYKNTCVAQCPDEFALTTEKNRMKHCVNECSVELFLNNNTCVNICPDNTFAYRNTCVAQCPDEFALTTEKNRMKHCVNECSVALFLNNNTCIGICPDDTFAYRNTCVAQCPKQEPFACKITFTDDCGIYNPTPGGLTFMSCRDTCPENMYTNTFTCANVCPVSLFTFNKTCLSICPSSHALVNPTTIVLKELRRSSYSSYTYWSRENIRECVNTCSGERVNHNSTCLNRCPDDHSYISNGSCQKEQCETKYSYNTSSGIQCAEKCPDDRYANKSTCVQQCPDNLVIFNKTCLEKCPDDNPIKQYLRRHQEERSIPLCVQSCKPYYFNDVYKCVEYCPKERNYRHNNTCMSKCPDTANLIDISKAYNKVCISECGANSVEHNSFCISSCPKESPYIHAMRCLKSCPTNATFKQEQVNGIQCLYKCSDVFFIYNDTCVSECPQNQKYTYNGKCLNSCPSFTRFQETSKSKNSVNCLLSCPDSEVFTNGQCIQATDCKDIVFDSQCLQTCPKGHFWFYAIGCLPILLSILVVIAVVVVISLTFAYCCGKTTKQYFELAKIAVCMCVQKDFEIDQYEKKVDWEYNVTECNEIHGKQHDPKECRDVQMDNTDETSKDDIHLVHLNATDVDLASGTALKLNTTIWDLWITLLFKCIFVLLV